MIEAKGSLDPRSDSVAGLGAIGARCWSCSPSKNSRCRFGLLSLEFGSGFKTNRFRGGSKGSGSGSANGLSTPLLLRATGSCTMPVNGDLDPTAKPSWFF